eukprot:tig00000076_g2465.t1
MDALGFVPTIYSLDDEIDLDEIFSDFRPSEQHEEKGLQLQPKDAGSCVTDNCCKTSTKADCEPEKMAIRRKGSCSSEGRGSCNPNQGCDTCKNASVCFPVIKNLETTLQRELSPLERWQALSDILDWVTEQPAKGSAPTEPPAAVAASEAQEDLSALPAPAAERTFHAADAGSLPDLQPGSPDLSVSTPSLSATEEDPATPGLPSSADGQPAQRPHELSGEGAAASPLTKSPKLPAAVQFGPRAVGQKALLARLAQSQRECVREIEGSLSALLPSSSARPASMHSLDAPLPLNISVAPPAPSPHHEESPAARPMSYDELRPSRPASRSASRAASRTVSPMARVALPPEAWVPGADSVPIGVGGRHQQLQWGSTAAASAAAAQQQLAAVKVEPMCLNAQPLQPAIARVQAASLYVDGSGGCFSPSSGYSSPMLSPPDSPDCGVSSGISSCGSLIDEAALASLPLSLGGLAGLAPWPHADLGGLGLESLGSLPSSAGPSLASSPLPIPARGPVASGSSSSSSKCPMREKKVARPHNCFILFMKEARPKLKEKWPHLTNAQISKLLGDLWAALPAEKKRKYEDMADRLREEFERQHPDLARDPLAAARRPRLSPVPPGILQQ